MAKRNISKMVTVDDDKKQVFCDMDNATDGAINTAMAYVKLGYELNPKRHTGDTRNADYWREQCQTDEQIDKFNAICKGKETYKGKSGFFAARSWIKNELKIK